MSKIVVYTAIFGKYDVLHDPLEAQPGVDYVCFTDQPFHSDIWDVRVQNLKATTKSYAARFRKTMSHVFLPDADYTLWVDGNVTIRYPRIFELFNTLLVDRDLAVFAHAERDCVYEEAKAVIALKKAFPSDVYRQMQAYAKNGYKAHMGMVETNAVLRRHSPAIKAFNLAWWNELITWTHRDQLSFNYVCWKLGMRYNIIPGNLRYNKCSWASSRKHGK